MGLMCPREFDVLNGRNGRRGLVDGDVDVMLNTLVLLASDDGDLARKIELLEGRSESL